MIWDYPVVRVLAVLKTRWVVKHKSTRDLVSLSELKQSLRLTELEFLSSIFYFRSAKVKEFYCPTYPFLIFERDDKGEETVYFRGWCYSCASLALLMYIEYNNKITSVNAW